MQKYRIFVQTRRCGVLKGSFQHSASFRDNRMIHSTAFQIKTISQKSICHPKTKHSKLPSIRQFSQSSSNYQQEQSTENIQIKNENTIDSIFNISMEKVNDIDLNTNTQSSENYQSELNDDQSIDSAEIHSDISLSEQNHIFKDTNIYSDEFKAQLMGFCHYYQIPFLDSNIPKSTRNAAKIYLRIIQDGQDINERFKNSLLIKYLKSIPQELIYQNKTENQFQEKWMRFFFEQNKFREIDFDRALQNDFSMILRSFIADNYGQFNDNQMIKAIQILSRAKESIYSQFKNPQIRQTLEDIVISRVITKQFDPRQSSLMEQLASLNLTSMQLNVKDTLSLRKPLGIFDQRFIKNDELNINQHQDIMLQYSKIILSINYLTPYYKYFLQYFNLQQKMNVVDMLTQYKIMDRVIFNSFMIGIKNILNLNLKKSQVQNTGWTLLDGQNNFYSHFQRILQRTKIQDPIDNSNHDNFVKLFDILDFQQQILNVLNPHCLKFIKYQQIEYKYDQISTFDRFVNQQINSNSNKAQMEMVVMDQKQKLILIQDLLDYLTINPQILTSGQLPIQKQLTNISMDNFLKVDAKFDKNAYKTHKIRLYYFDGLVDLMLKQYQKINTAYQKDFCSWTLANNLVHNLDYEYVQKKKIFKLANILFKQIEQEYQNVFEPLMIRHIITQKTIDQDPNSGTYQNLQEVVKSITKFVDTLEMSIQFCLKNFSDQLIHDQNIISSLFQTYTKTLQILQCFKQTYTSNYFNNELPELENHYQGLLNNLKEQIPENKSEMHDNQDSYSFELQNEIRNQYKLFKYLIPINKFAVKLQKVQDFSNNPWCQYLVCLSKLCSTKPEIRNKYILQTQELDRLQTLCFSSILKQIKLQQQIDPSTNQIFQYVNPMRSNTHKKINNDSGQSFSQNQDTEVSLQQSNNQQNQIFMDELSYYKIKQYISKHKSHKLIDIFYQTPELISFKLPLCFSGNHAATNRDQMTLNQLDPLTGFGFPYLPKSEGVSYACLEIFQSAIELKQLIKNLVSTAKSVIMNNHAENGIENTETIQKILDVFQMLSIEERILIISSDLQLFKDLIEILEFSELVTTINQPQIDNTIQKSNSILKILGQFITEYEQSNQTNYEINPENVKINFVEVLEDKNRLASHSSSQIQKTDEIYLSFNDFGNQRQKQFQNIFKGPRHELGIELNQNVNKIIEILCEEQDNIINEIIQSNKQKSNKDQQQFTQSFEKSQFNKIDNPNDPLDITSIQDLKPYLTYISNFCNCALNLNQQMETALDNLQSRIYASEQNECYEQIYSEEQLSQIEELQKQLINVDYSSIQQECAQTNSNDKPLGLTDLIYIKMQYDQLLNDQSQQGLNKSNQNIGDQIDQQYNQVKSINRELLADLNIALSQSGVIHQFKQAKIKNTNKRQILFKNYNQLQTQSTDIVDLTDQSNEDNDCKLSLSDLCEQQFLQRLRNKNNGNNLELNQMISDFCVFPYNVDYLHVSEQENNQKVLQAFIRIPYSSDTVCQTEYQNSQQLAAQRTKYIQTNLHNMFIDQAPQNQIAKIEVIQIPHDIHSLNNTQSN